MEIMFDEQEFLRKIAELEGRVVEEKKPKVKKDNVVVGITYIDFMESFKQYYPDIKLIRSLEQVKNFDLIIVPGGEDVNPRLYNEPNNYSSINEQRDAVEVPIVKQALSLRKKIYAVCRGHQLVNALSGGKLFQDLMEEKNLTHSGWHPLDEINDPIIQKYFGGKMVRSTHHQAVRNTHLTITSMHKGVIESCRGNNIITTQFHPEFQDGNEDFFKYLLEWASYQD